MTAWLLALALSATQPTSVVGKVRLTKAVGSPQVSIKPASGAETVLKGDLVDEIRSLQSATVEAMGLNEEGYLLVQGYRIVDINGAKPLVGLLVETQAGLGLLDGEGTPVPLNVSTKLKQKLSDQMGAKLWVVGQKLVTGELKVTRFGILKKPVRPEPKQPDNGDTQLDR